MTLCFADCKVDRASRELSVAGAPVAIEPKAFDLLLYLIDHRERAVGKDELQDAVWGTIVSDSALTRCVMKLRKALGETSAAAVKTVPRFGYRFDAPVVGTETATDDPAPRRLSIAVLPLANLSDDPENEYFSDGLAEEILNLLARIPALRVASRTSAFAFRGQNDDIRRIAEQLDVDYVLEGSVRRFRDRVRITQQLIDARNDAHLWSEVYDRRLDDVFAVQEEIAKRVVGAFDVDTAGLIRPRSETGSFTAYDYYLRGRHYFHQWDRGAFAMSHEMFEKAIAIDPGYARAWAGLADTATCTVMWQDEDDRIIKRADEASRKAMALAPELAESHVARGFALSQSGRYAEAAERFDAALQRDPMLFEAWYLYGRARFAEGNMPESARLFLKAAEVRPDDYQSLCLAVQPFEVLGDLDTALSIARRAVARCRRNLELHPEDTRAWTLGAGALVALDERDEAVQWLDRALEIGGDDIGVLHNAGCVLAELGLVDQSLDVFEKRFALGKAHKDWIDNDPSFDGIRDHPRFRAMCRF